MLSKRDARSDSTGEVSTTSIGDETDPHARNRWRATVAVLPFLVLGLSDVLLVVYWGIDPLWGFLILPPIIFITVVGWLGFRTGFARERQ